MSIQQAHGANIEEIGKFSSIYSLNNFSIAEYKDDDKGIMKAFRHSHEEYEFIIPLTTVPLLYYAKADYIGEVGYCYPVNPHVEHGLEFDLHSHLYSIVISKQFVEDIKSFLGLKGEMFYTRFLYKKQLIDCIQKYQQEFINNGAEGSKNIVLIANEIATILVKTGLKTGIDTRRPEKQYNRNIKLALIAMFENYQDPNFTVFKAAEISEYSNCYFSKAFKAYVHESPITHLNKLRISYAKSLFGNKELSLMEIAKRSGYCNLSTFTEAFKKSMKMTPLHYRKKYCL